MQEISSFVSPGDIEALLSSVAQKTGSSREGFFGPDSMSWKINRESALFLGAGRAALLQLAHPWVSAALRQHSNLLSNPIARFHNTFRIVFTMLFGTREQALASARHLYTLHTGIRGEIPEGVARYPKNSHYEANEIAALRWVYATLVESAVLAYECVLPELKLEEREIYYTESKRMAALFGIPSAALPENWTAFTTYNRQMWESDALGVNDLSRSMADAVLSGAGSWIHPPHWYRSLTAAWLPARFQEEFSLRLQEADRRGLDRATRWLPRIYRKLPNFIRFAGPYHEAMCRLNNKPAGSLARWSNNFWIGQPRLPFGCQDSGAQI